MRSEEFVKRNAAGNLTFGKDPAATVIFYSHCLKIKHGVMTSCSDTNTGQIYYIIHPVLPTHTHTHTQFGITPGMPENITTQAELAARAPLPTLATRPRAQRASD